MSQAVLRPNLTKKFQWEVSQIADKERSLTPLYRWFKCKLKPPKNRVSTEETTNTHNLHVTQVDVVRIPPTGASFP